MSDNWILAEHLYEILKQEEIVVIPHFGAFVSDQESAKIEQLVIRPPHKKIIFNKNVVKDDGVLNNWISQILQQEYLQSKLTIAEAVYGWRKALSYGEKISFENIGELNLNLEGQIVFEGLQHQLLQGEFFGLDQVVLSKSSIVSAPVQIEEPKLINEKPVKKKIIPLNTEVKKEEKPETKVVPIASPKHKKTKLGKIAVVMLPLTCIGIGIFGASTFDKENSLASLFTSKETQTIVDNSIDIKVQKIEKASDFFSSEEIELIKKEQEKKEKASIETIPAVKSNQTDIKQFHVIAGCFSNKSNAEKLKLSLIAEGYDAQLVGKTKNGLYRVSFSSFNIRKQAMLVLAKVKLNKNKGSWLLKESIDLQASSL
jgi:hypothetical protein